MKSDFMKKFIGNYCAFKNQFVFIIAKLIFYTWTLSFIILLYNKIEILTFKIGLFRFFHLKLYTALILFR